MIHEIYACYVTAAILFELFSKTISLAPFVCDFVFLQHGRQNLCFLNLK